MKFKATILILFIQTCSILNAQNQYDSYIINNQCDAFDYIDSLFNRNDLIIICEREHPEMSQYEFFYDLVSKKWFISNVGVVILEVPTRSIQQELDNYLYSENLSIEEAQNKLMHIYRNLDTGILWTKTNLYYFLKKIYELNQNLSAENKIRIIGTDMEFSWLEIQNREDYLNKKSTLDNRDKDIAEFILKWYDNALKNREKSKALIIMNYRHAYGNKYWTSSKKYEADNVARYIREALPQNSTNIYLNSFAYSKIFGMRKRHANGKWDKAFRVNENQTIGIKLQGSPFGNDDFDDFPYIKTDLKWKDVFDHLIFHNPINDFNNSFGIEGLVDEEFEAELKRRYKIANIKLTKKTIRYINMEKCK